MSCDRERHRAGHQQRTNRGGHRAARTPTALRFRGQPLPLGVRAREDFVVRAPQRALRDQVRVQPLVRIALSDQPIQPADHAASPVDRQHDGLDARVSREQDGARSAENAAEPDGGSAPPLTGRPRIALGRIQETSQMPRAACAHSRGVGITPGGRQRGRGAGRRRCSRRNSGARCRERDGGCDGAHTGGRRGRLGVGERSRGAEREERWDDEAGVREGRGKGASRRQAHLQ